MLTYKEAYKIVERELGIEEREDIRIYEESTIDLEYGWIFFWNVKYWSKTNFLVGNSPVIVNKFTSELFWLGTAYSVECGINAYEEKMNGFKNIWVIQLKKKVGLLKYFKAIKISRSSIYYYGEILSMLNSHPNIIKKGEIKRILPIKYMSENVGVETIMTNINAKKYNNQRPWINDIAKLYSR